MEAVLTHLQDNALIYSVATVILAPIIYFTRKYSVPTILYCVEFLIYAGIVHVVMHVLVRVTRCAKESSSMRALDSAGRPEDAPEWSTPLIEFWNTAAYDPNWVWKAELASLVIVLILMWRYRPMKIQRKSGRKTQEYGAKKSGPGAKGAARGKAGGYKASRGTRGR